MTASPSRNPGVQAEIDKLAADYPGRDFWHVHASHGPGAWCTKPDGAAMSDIVRSTSRDLREALEEVGDPAP